MSNKKRGSRPQLTSNSVTRTLSVKCYDEQLKNGWNAVCESIAHLPQEMQVIAIKHDKDYATDDIWAPSLEKPHYHIIYRSIDRQVRHVSTILNMLGIEYRKGTDDNLWKNHGVETIKDFSSMTAYLTHETEAAELAGKTVYSHEELISNLSVEDIEAIRQGYIRAVNRKVDGNDMALLDKKAFELGYELQDFDEWYDSLDFFERSHSKMRIVKESYDRGVAKNIREHKFLLRTCIFIEGVANTGKTYGTLKALEGKRVITVEGGGTGKFDLLRPTTEAIVINDDTCDNLIVMSDNYPCYAYRRNSGNQCWTGNMLVITSNLSFEDYVKKCFDKPGATGFKTRTSSGAETREFAALKSRFFICHLKDKKLYCETPSTRGTVEDCKKRCDIYKEFKDKFDQSIGSYVPVSPREKMAIFADINSDFKMTDEEKKRRQDEEAECRRYEAERYSDEEKNTLLGVPGTTGRNIHDDYLRRGFTYQYFAAEKRMQWYYPAGDIAFSERLT